MKKSKFVAMAAAVGLSLSSTASFGIVSAAGPAPTFHGAPPAAFWTIFGCTGGIISAALAANFQQNRQLTWNEAATCGLAFWLTSPRHK
jgi:hypothetical protein